MPRPKHPRVFAIAPAHSPAAIKEWQEGIAAFLDWANLARTRETSRPEAVLADQTLTAFSQGCFNGAFRGLSLPAVLAGKNILALLRNAHWHLQACPECNRWLLAKDRRRALCRRIECVRTVKAQQRAAQRKARRALTAPRPDVLFKATDSTFGMVQYFCIMARIKHQGKRWTPPAEYSLSLKVSRQLATDLQRIARTESNSISAVARRLMSEGVSREPRAAEDSD